MEHFTDKLFNEYLTEGNVTLPLYCGNSVTMSVDDHKIYAINLPLFSEWAVGKTLSKNEADLFRGFIAEKISNGTLHTEDAMKDYPQAKRLQLFLNSNIAEQTVQAVLGGERLDGNDDLTLNSTAVIGSDGCAKADAIINGIEVEVKVTHNDATAEMVLKKAHKKPVVAVYVISPTLKSHWYCCVRTEAGNYIQVPEVPTTELDTAVLAWQTALRKEAPALPLLYLRDETDGSLSISKMWQR